MKQLLRASCASLAILLPALSHSAATEGQIQAIAAARADYDVAQQAIKREDWTAALAALKNAERNDPQSADVQNMLGYTTRQKGDVDGALRYYERALVLNPSHRGAHEYMGQAYLLKGLPEKAKEHLARLEEICSGLDKCPERESLKRAIADWDPWKRGTRTTKSY
jgi:tetratricopeptide (TPR) repeat protein